MLIKRSGICGSDLHTLRSGWKPTSYPCCVGHEIVGTVVRAGKNVLKGIKVGDRVGCGAQCGSCGHCEFCKNGMENRCPEMVETYNAKFADGSSANGGYADFQRFPSRLAIPIPKELSSAQAAPMLCAGITVYSPLKNHGAGPGKSVGIIGIGGLGHYGLLFAKALGADHVTAISRNTSKKADCEKLGADGFIATDEKDWESKHAKTLDLIVCTANSPKMPLTGYLGLLKTHGTFVIVGAPEDALPPFNAFALIGSGASITGSLIGPPGQIEEMLALAVKKNIRGWIEERPMKDANQAIQDMEANKARFRYVLVNEKHTQEEGTGTTK